MPPVSVDPTSVGLETVLHENQGALLGYFQRRIPNAEDAVEAYGELLLTAWRIRRRMPKDPLNARMWLYGVARNIVRSEKRALARHSDAVKQLCAQASIDVAAVPDGEHADLRDAIAALDEEDAELIRLTYWDGLPSHEAAAVLGINPSTARSRLTKLKTALRAAVEQSRAQIGERHV